MSDKTLIQKNKKCSARLAELLRQELPPLIRINTQIYSYNNKYYDEKTDDDLTKIIYKFLKDNDIIDEWRMNRINEIIKALKNCDEIKEINALDNYDNLMNLNNGIYNLDTFELQKHSEDFYFSYVINAEYKENEGKKAINFQEFLSKLFTLNNNNPDIGTIANIIRLGGYLLYPQNKIEKMFIFLGEGANGKSVLIDIFSLFFERKFITALNLKQLSNTESFSREQLLLSKINITTEERGEKVDSEEIKRIISGEYTEVMRKYKKNITFKPCAKLLIASNSNPYFNDTSYGLHRRLMIFDFKNKFIEDKEEYAKIKNPIKKRIFPALDKKKLLDKIKEEKNIILKLFLLGLKDIKEKNWIFPVTKNNTDIMATYKEVSDKVGYFLSDNYIENEEIDILKADNSEIKNKCLTVSLILSEYKEWYKNNISDKIFYENTKSIMRKIDYLFRISRKRISTYQNGKELKENYYPLKRKEEIIEAEYIEEISEINS